MRISLMYDELLFDIKTKNRAEVAVYDDPAIRYRAEIGSDKEEEIKRCILSAFATLTNTYMRFMRAGEVVAVDNQSYVPEQLEVEIVGSERRLGGKMPMIADIMHSLLVNMTLSKFYLTCGQSDLSTMRDSLAAADVQTLQKLIYSKQPPRLC